MCGISETISLNTNITDKNYIVSKNMSDSINHRGPDQQKIEKFDKIIIL
jgi:asparagine synthetase B (glutamine-hydrolysing)